MSLVLFLRIKSILLEEFPTSQTFSSPTYHQHCPRSVLGSAARSCKASGQLEGLCCYSSSLPLARLAPESGALH